MEINLEFEKARREDALLAVTDRAAKYYLELNNLKSEEKRLNGNLESKVYLASLFIGCALFFIFKFSLETDWNLGTWIFMLGFGYGIATNIDLAIVKFKLKNLMTEIGNLEIIWCSNAGQGSSYKFRSLEKICNHTNTDYWEQLKTFKEEISSIVDKRIIDIKNESLMREYCED